MSDVAGNVSLERIANPDIFDTLTNSSVPIDLLYGFEVVRRGRGNDMMMSQDSSETLNGRKGNDALVGLEGRDKLFGGAGEDY